MEHQQEIRTEIAKTITSTFNWRIKNIQFMRENGNSHELKTREVKFENSSFKWWILIYSLIKEVYLMNSFVGLQ